MPEWRSGERKLNQGLPEINRLISGLPCPQKPLYLDSEPGIKFLQKRRLARSLSAWWRREPFPIIRWASHLTSWLWWAFKLGLKSIFSLPGVHGLGQSATAENDFPICIERDRVPRAQAQAAPLCPWHLGGPLALPPAGPGSVHRLGCEPHPQPSGRGGFAGFAVRREAGSLPGASQL